MVEEEGEGEEIFILVAELGGLAAGVGGKCHVRWFLGEMNFVFRLSLDFQFNIIECDRRASLLIRCFDM